MRGAILGVLVVVGWPMGSAWAQVKLERHYEEESTEVSQVETKSRQILSINGMDSDTGSTQMVVVSSKIGKRGEDGILPIINKVDRLKRDMAMPRGARLQFDSEDPDRAPEIPEFEALLKSMRASARSRWTTKINEKNEIASVEYEKGLGLNLDGEFKTQFDPERLKKSLREELALFPDTPVSQGDTWKRTVEKDIGVGQMLSLVVEYQYQGAAERKGRTLDEISSKVVGVALVPDPKAKTGPKMTAREMKVLE
ncbi:MAG: DUF6263 family protein, partial [Planctomycetales bacterium]